MMVEVLERKGVPYEYIAFEGEGHGFRKQENIVRAVEAELAFVAKTFDLCMRRSLAVMVKAR